MNEFQHLGKEDLISLLIEKERLIQSLLNSQQPTIIHGILGLAKYLKISHTTAQKLKDSGKFRVYSAGKKLYFKPDEVHQGLLVT